MDNDQSSDLGRPFFEIPDAKPDRFLRMYEVSDMTSISKSAVYRKMADGKFPRSFQILPGRSAWRESEVVEWMSAPLDWKLKTLPR